jgi:hypothetical protein
MSSRGIKPPFKVFFPYYSESELRKNLGVPEDFYAKTHTALHTVNTRQGVLGRYIMETTDDIDL